MVGHYKQFLARVIDDGIAAARHDYAEPRNAQKLAGAIAGFEACRGLDPLQILDALIDANARADQAFRDRSDDYWFHRCFALEVEWVANCLSAVLMNEGRPTIIPPTARGVFKAAQIIGVSANNHADPHTA